MFFHFVCETILRSGIKDEHEKIFKRFYRAEGDKENTFAGFGIGLYIAKDIVQKHRGNLTLEMPIVKDLTV